MTAALNRAAAGEDMSLDWPNGFSFNRQDFAVLKSELIAPNIKGLIKLGRYRWETTCRTCGGQVEFLRWAHDVTSPVKRFCDPCQAKSGELAAIVETVEDDASEGLDLV